MKIADIRAAFLTYFSSKGHEVVASSSLVPANDPSLLFTNAGMVQFKDVFLGRESKPYKRAVSSQRVVRAGGKHNDLENVGYTARHHTFFEMLGNFSFGDYFKSEAIAYAWEFLTQVMKLPQEKLWVTVYKDDKEAEKIWFEEIGVDPARFSRLGEKDNFWSMGDTGPCGPCTEIFYDHGPSVPGGPPGSPDEDGDRYIEIWNLVFMQYDKQPGGELLPLPKPSVDTGMGLERLAAVMQGVHNNYEIDLFEALIGEIAVITGVKDLSNRSLRVLADHVRAAGFLICDGVTPSNEGRGYVLRRIIRRALRHANKLGVEYAFFYKCIKPLLEQMGCAYPELKEAGSKIESALRREEDQFAVTLEQGLKILEQDIETMNGSEISGITLFTLYDTYGFPVDLTADIARERGLKVDLVGFEREMSQQRLRSKQGSAFESNYYKGLNLALETEFKGYESLFSESCVHALYLKPQGDECESVNQLRAGQEGVLVSEQTSFYGEAGGQVGDCGWIEQGAAKFEVTHTTRDNKTFLHHGVMLKGEFKVGQTVQFAVDPAKRLATARNHSATHLLHAALRKVLGSHVLQKGSLVDSGKLRFDFSHIQPVSFEEIKTIESLVNEEIMSNTSVTTQLMDLQSAKKSGASALFGEKYESEVRVLSMGRQKFSTELCGGTHVDRTGDIGFFKILSESGIASGIRRVEAVTGVRACQSVQGLEQIQRELGEVLKSTPEKLLEKAKSAVAFQKQLEKELKELKGKLASNSSSDLMDQVLEVSGVKVLFAEVDVPDAQSLRTAVDQLKSKLVEGVVLLSFEDKKARRAQLAAGVTKGLTHLVPAGDLIKFCAEQVGGKGGGRKDFAMAGGGDPLRVKKAFEAGLSWLENKLKVVSGPS